MDSLADAEDAPIPAWDDAETANKFEPFAPTLPPDSAGTPDEAFDEAPPSVVDEVPVASTTATKTSALSPDEIAKARAELRRIIGSLRAAPEGPFEGLKSPNAKPAPAMSKSEVSRSRRRRESQSRRNEQARIGAENRIASNKIANSVS
jgi:hypothetical protein